MEEVLEGIGLTKNEIKVYLALNKLGLSKIGPIVENAQITNSKIYIILDKLIHKGLVSHSIINGTKHFKTAHPQRLIDFLEEKKKKIELEEIKIHEILPKLLSQQEENPENRIVEVYEGFNGLKTARERILQSMKKGEEMLILGASKFSASKYEYYWENYHKRRIKKGILCRYLAYEETRKEEGKKRGDWKLTKIRYILDPPTNPIRVDICLDYVNLAIDAMSPFVISIKSKEMSDSFRNYFEQLWRVAKK